MKVLREILGMPVKLSEQETHWREFLQSLQARGLHGIELITSDAHSGLKAAKRLSNTVSVNSLNFLALIRKQSKYF